MSAAVILQARMGSTRLPGKVLMPIGKWSLLAHCVRRLQASRRRVIVATTTDAADAAVAREAERLGADVFRGHPTDVLDRYCAAARAHELTYVMRATADNPFVDGDAVGRTLDLLAGAGADHVIEFGLPVGAAVEAVTADALARAHGLATDPYDREHVTSFIRRDERFYAIRAVATGAVRRPGLRLTVDTAEDLDFARRVYEHLGEPDAIVPLKAVIAAADARIVKAMGDRALKQGA